MAAGGRGETPDFLERLASLSPDPMYVVDVIEHRFLYLNDATVQLLGISKEKLSEPNAAYLLLERIHPDDIGQVIKRYEKLGTSQEEPNGKFPDEGIVYRLLNAAGKWRWFESRETVFARSPEGGITQLVGIARDIDDRKRVEDELFNSREKLRLFIEHTPAPIAVLDTDLRYMAVSRRWITDYRLPDIDLIGKHHFEMFPEVPDKWKLILDRCLLGAVERNEGAKFIRSDGRVQWIRWEVRPWYTVNQGIGGIIIYSEDITERILTDQETRRNTEDLRYAQRLAHVGSWSWVGPSLKTGYRYSEEILRIYGLDPAERFPYFHEQKGRIFSPEDWEKINVSSETTFSTGTTTDVEVQAVRGDGSSIWIISRIEAIRDGNDKIIGLRGTVHDITERKKIEAERHENELRLRESLQSEELLIESRRRLQAIFDSLFGFIGLFTLDGIFVEVNQTVLDIGGLQRDQVIGKHLYKVVWFAERKETQRRLKMTFARAARGETLRFEFPAKVADGSEIIIDATFGPLRDKTGKIVNIIGFGVDITPRINAQRELRESRAWLELALQTASLGSWRYDLNTGIFTGDLFSRTLHGVAEQESFDSFESTTKYLHPDDLPEIQEKFQQLLSDGSPISAEYRIKTPDSPLRWIQSTGRLDPETSLLIATVQDITDRKLADDQLAKLRDELAHAARLGTMGEMASWLAHELNQPLAALQIYSHTALTVATRANVEGLVPLLQKISAQSHRAGEIIRRMRSFVSRGVHRPTLANSDRLIQDVLLLMETYLRHHSVSVDYESSVGLPQIRVDVVQIQQVLVNLIRNAVEAMSDAEPKLLTIRVSSVESGLCFYVSDTGMGIDPEISKHLFQPFQTTKENGMGLGLAISRSLVEAHGGKIFVTSNNSGGATFSFTLPFEASDESS